MNLDFILPALCLALMTLLIGLWAVLARARAMYALRIHPQAGQDVIALREKLPASANRIANNYNHLLEQPTLFYVISVVLALLAQACDFILWLAWGYVVLRAMHSVVQTTNDKVMWRFKLFLLSTLVLLVLVVSTMWLLLAT